MREFGIFLAAAAVLVGGIVWWKGGGDLPGGGLDRIDDLPAGKRVDTEAMRDPARITIFEFGAPW